MTVGEDRPRVEIGSRAELRRWLADHHAESGAVWLVTAKKGAAASYLTYDEIVDELISFGWVDSLPREVDDARSMRLIAPRKRGSAWSAVNKARVVRLTAAGLMQPSGLKKVETAKADGSWSALDAVEALTIPQDLAEALAAVPLARLHFEAFPRSSKRLILEWITSAKRPETRAARINETAAMAARNLRANHHRQPKGAG